ncbi:hypothetical protein PHMEG_0004741 [Phytophthora megakarya]|uniref:Uncharacterized protein n=1 Tax=Phytophthora megakarya TaxID=4795 RepID=A0A225WT36_9STRA|nr:hypothetical protein PHMEG_0004741 [Phytophthora megakarya]
MKLPFTFAWATIAIAHSTHALKSKVSSKSELNGWYSCSDYTFSDQGSSSGQLAECAIYNAPLCYPGICKTPASIDPTIEVFVKRFPATTDPNAASNVWFLQGGPGYSSSALEAWMVTLHKKLKGTVNVYTMDYRGTGRSTKFDCMASQTTTTGSPSGGEIDPSEVGACAQDLEFKYGDLSSFSMTSAATDVVAFLSKYSNGKSNIIYGTSYGTALVERLMHLKPPNVVGYAFDGIATSSGSPEGGVEYVSTWDTDNGEVGDRFLALCKHNRECNARFNKNSLSLTIQNLYKAFDKNPNSTCAALLNNIKAPSINTGEQPSFTLRRALGTMLRDSTLRTFIPPIVYRLHRCRQKDVDLLPQFFSTFSENADPKTQDTAYVSNLLYSLITFSEMWETPAPSMAKMKKRFTDVVISDSGLYATNPLYCAFSKEKSPTCNKLGLGNYDANPIIYDRDEFWNKRATIPKGASALLLSSKLDTQTPHKYAEYFLEALRGENKELVTFQYSIHGVLGSTQLIDGDMYSETCGMKLFASYVKHKGNLEKMDKSCVDEMPGFNLTIPTDYLNSYMSTKNPYDGVYDQNISAQYY